MLAFFVAALIIFLGFLGEEFFKRTSIPEPILLLTFGVFLGPIFGLFPRENLISITPYFSALALIVILFDGGLNMNIKDTFRHSLRALLLSILTWLLSVLVVAVLCKFLLDWRWLNGLLLGSIVGGTSSVVVLSLLRKIKNAGKSEVILSLESILTDVFCTVGAFIFIGIILSGEVSLQAALGSIAAAFGVGIIIGSLFGFSWLFMLDKLKGKPNTYMLTFAVLLLAFFVASTLGGTGAISALFMGLILGNSGWITKKINFKCSVSIGRSVRGFHSQINFLIRSFFFVFTGLMFSFSSLNIIIFGVALGFILLAVRFLAVRVATFKAHLDGKENLMTIMLPRGLAAAVLASLPFTSGIPDSEVFPEIAFMVILTTIIICTVGVFIYQNKKSIKEKIEAYNHRNATKDEFN
jgi:potassium/hydrogen antiporter